MSALMNILVNTSSKPAIAGRGSAIAEIAENLSLWLRRNRRIATVDRRRALVMRVFVAGLALVAAACAGPAALSLPQEAQWIAPGRDISAILAKEPVVCVKLSADKAQNDAVRRGEIAFNSPFLLGGQAAKQGISCAACHRNGRGNPDFFFADLSDAAGRVDVSQAFFGPAREDHRDNPVKIPDLALPEGQKMVDRADDQALTAFLTSQIIDEFHARAPGQTVLDGLKAYLRSIDTANCAPNAVQKVRMEGFLALGLDAYRTSFAVDNAADRAFFAIQRGISCAKPMTRLAGKGARSLRQRLVLASAQMEKGADFADIEADLQTISRQIAARSTQLTR
jgi:hypothetical protein